MAKLRLSKKATKAVLASIRHWEEDILRPLQAGKKIRMKNHEGHEGGRRTLHWAGTKDEVQCYMDDCPLCKFTGMPNSASCDECPYTLKHGKECDDHAWSKFYKRHTLENCEAMVASLKAILE